MTLAWVLAGLIAVPLLSSVVRGGARRRNLAARVRGHDPIFYNNDSSGRAEGGEAGYYFIDGGGEQCGGTDASDSADSGGCDGGGDGGGGDGGGGD